MQKNIGKICSILIIVGIFFPGTQLFAMSVSDLSSPNTGVANNRVAPYPGSASTASSGNCCTASGSSSASWIQLGNLYQIRQSGAITSIKFGWSATSGTGKITGVYFDVWRRNASDTFNLVGESENLLASLTTGSVNTVTLASPMQVQEGDNYGFRETGTFPANNFNLVNSDAGDLFYTSSQPASTNFDWELQQSKGEGEAITVEVYMNTGPNFASISDSLFSGYPDTFSGCDTYQDIWDPPSDDSLTIAHQLALKLQPLFGSMPTYDNCSISGDPLTNIANRFQTDALNAKPKFVITGGGWNDVWGGATQTQVHNAWKKIFDADQAAGIPTLAVLMIPITDAGSAEHSKADTWNADLKNLAKSYPSVILVDTSTYIGQARPGGPAGNLWDTKPQYLSDDNTHPNPAGKERIAQAFYDALVNALGTTPPSTKTGDLNNDNKVDIFDYNILVGNFGKTGVGVSGGDIDGNGKVDIFDYNQLVGNFGK